MRKQPFYDIYVPIVVFQSNRKFTEDSEARKYALDRIDDGSYENCIIGEVYVDRVLVLENYKV